MTVFDGRSWPLLMFSLAVCSAADRNSSAFMHNTNCSAKLKNKRAESLRIGDTEVEEPTKLPSPLVENLQLNLESDTSEFISVAAATVVINVLLQGLSR